MICDKSKGGVKAGVFRVQQLSLTSDAVEALTIAARFLEG